MKYGQKGFGRSQESGVRSQWERPHICCFPTDS
jgi:hypothetical protein